MQSFTQAWRSIDREFKHAGRNAWAMLGLDKNFFRNARGARILIYHGLCLKDHTRFNPIFLTKDTFEDHLKFYRQYFNVVSLDQFYAGELSNDRFNVCITFDDGFANNFKYALPLLEKYKMPASFLITAIREAGFDILWNDFLSIVSKYGPRELKYQGKIYFKNRFGRYAEGGNGSTLVDRLKENGFQSKKEMMENLHDYFPFKAEEEDYWKQMTEEEIRQLSASPFVTIGSHGYYHNRMDKLPMPSVIEEMRHSKQYIERLAGKEVRAFAFPYGNYSRDIVAEAKKIGYSQFLAMDFHFEEDKNDASMRERFTVNPFISVNNQMHATVTRHYE
jgi:peptidoglycan/xylan/chitin deacetylase (PgdA/CDA1 family)